MEDINRTFSKLASINYKVRQQVWVPVKQLFIKKTTNYTWGDPESQSVFENLPWKRGQPNGKNYQQCVDFQPKWKTFQV